MVPIMSFKAELEPSLIGASSPLSLEMVVLIAAEALKILPKAPISVNTIRFVINSGGKEFDCLAIPINGYKVAYSIRDEKIKILMVEKDY